MKKMLFNVGAIVVFLLLCWRIGLILYPDGEGKQEEGKEIINAESSMEENSVEGSSSTEQYEAMQDIGQLKEENLSFLNGVSVGDNPWGFTAGIIEVDPDGQCLFLTPGTGVVIDGISDMALDNNLGLQFKIHPWVSEDSDGAGITISFKDQDAKTMRKERMLVTKQDDWQSVGDSLKMGEIAQIEILCDGGDNSDETADWVIIRLPFSIVRE